MGPYSSRSLSDVTLNPFFMGNPDFVIPGS
jgi:hypothetical protein